uniref:Uncharacterized protein n=1 Tax=Glossina austeni TaxID=7395 RepID=A0A1A9VBJ4_GLOAU
MPNINDSAKVKTPKNTKLIGVLRRASSKHNIISIVINKIMNASQNRAGLSHKYPNYNFIEEIKHKQDGQTVSHKLLTDALKASCLNGSYWHALNILPFASSSALKLYSINPT